MSSTRCFGVPFEVEGLGQVVGGESVVCDRDLRVECLLPDPSAEVAALLEEPVRAQRVVREPADQLGDGARAEYRPVCARLELTRFARASCNLGRLPRRRGRVDLRYSPVRLLGPAGSAVRGREAEAHRVSELLVRGEARARCESELRDAAREVAVEPEVGRCLDRRCGETRLVLGPERRGLLVVAGRVRKLGRRSEPGEVRIGPRAVGGLGGSLGKRLQAVGVDPVRRRPADLPVADDSDPHDRVVDERWLVDDRPREARNARALRVDEHLGLVALCGAEGLLGEVEPRAQARRRPRRHGSELGLRRARRAPPGRAAPCRSSSGRRAATPPARRPRRACPRTQVSPRCTSRPAASGRACPS